MLKSNHFRLNFITIGQENEIRDRKLALAKIIPNQILSSFSGRRTIEELTAGSDEAQWLERATSIRKTLVRSPARMRCAFFIRLIQLSVRLSLSEIKEKI